MTTNRLKKKIVPGNTRGTTMAPTATRIQAMISGSLEGGWYNKSVRGR